MCSPLRGSSSRTTTGSSTDAERPKRRWRCRWRTATPEKQASLRSFKNGKLKLTDDGRLLPHEQEEGVDRSGFTENWWFGLSCLHTLFTKEHNSICERLKS